MVCLCVDAAASQLFYFSSSKSVRLISLGVVSVSRSSEIDTESFIISVFTLRFSQVLKVEMGLPFNVSLNTKFCLLDHLVRGISGGNWHWVKVKDYDCLRRAEPW